MYKACAQKLTQKDLKPEARIFFEHSEHLSQILNSNCLYIHVLYVDSYELSIRLDSLSLCILESV